MRVGDTLVYLKRRASTTYDKATIIKLLGIAECLEYGLLTVNDTAVTKYLKEHPDIKIESNQSYSNPFLSTRKING